METANKKRPSGETARPFCKLGGIGRGSKLNYRVLASPLLRTFKSIQPSRSTPLADPSGVTFRKIILKDNDKELSKDKRLFL